jgi:hypothetical protein
MTSFSWENVPGSGRYRQFWQKQHIIPTEIANVLAKRSCFKQFLDHSQWPLLRESGTQRAAATRRVPGGS